MMSAVAPVWDGNETWLVVTGVLLWGAFPLVYATLLSAFYLPLLLMLAGLILRGVAFEFRNKTERMRWLWDASFAGGSLVAAFMQGLTVGALVEGLPIADGRYVGGEFGWLSPFALLCGVGLCIGYALLGACWLVRKCEGDVRDAAYRLIPHCRSGCSLPGRRLCLRTPREPSGHGPLARAAVSVRLSRDRRARRPSCWRAASVSTSTACRFPMVALIFAAAFGTLAISFWPYMIPFSITIEQAAAPHASLAFMFWGAGLFVFPLMLIYTAISYRVFRGKVTTAKTY